MVKEKVIIGIPTARPVVQEEFLDSLERMSESYEDLFVVFSTSDLEYKEDLETELEGYQINYKIIGKEEVEKPDYAKNRLWDINQQRRNIRDYFFSTDARYILYLDDDVVISDKDAINKFIDIMEEERIQVLCSAYRNGSNLIAPAYGCAFIRRNALKHIEPRTFETRSGEMIPGEYFFVMDMVSNRIRWISKAFVRTLHLKGSGFEVRKEELSKRQVLFRSWGIFGLLRGLKFYIDYYLLELGFDRLRRSLYRLAKGLVELFSLN